MNQPRQLKVISLLLRVNFPPIHLRLTKYIFYYTVILYFVVFRFCYVILIANEAAELRSEAGVSNTPYLGSDVTLLAFVPRLDSEPACSLLTIPNQCVLSSIDTVLKRLKIKETNRLR